MEEEWKWGERRQCPANSFRAHLQWLPVGPSPEGLKHCILGTNVQYIIYVMYRGLHLYSNETSRPLSGFEA